MVLSFLGEASFHAGHYAQAITHFRRIHAVDPLCLRNMDMFAYLLAKEKKYTDLQK